jgi:hypothetical protein
MIFEFFLGFLTNIVAGIVELFLPEAGDLGLVAPTGLVVGYTWLNTFLPISEAIVFALILLGLYLAGFAWRLFLQVYHLIPKPWMGT